MSDTSANLSLSYLLPAQAQKHVTVNEALRALDALVQLSVVSRSLSAPPADPAEGARYLIPAGASGDWSGRDGDVACRQDGAWAFHAPQTGWIAWIEDEGGALGFDGSGWRSAFGALDSLGVNATADATNRLAVGGPASLFDGAGGGHQLKLNKSAPTDTASVLFQTGYSGRAEFGLTGSDNFEIKTSDDGEAWATALTINTENGRIGVGKAPGSEALEIDGGVRSVSADAAFIQLLNTGPDGANVWIGVPDWNRRAFYIYGGAGDIMSVYDTITRSLRLFSGGAERLRIDSDGDVGIGVTAPTARLHVNGAVRVGSFTKSALPAAGAAGAGALAYVTNAAGGAQLACSDGAQWRKVRDGQVV